MQKGPTKEEREKNFVYWNTFSVHRWYYPLKEFTFETVFIDLSVEDCRAFVAYQELLLAENPLQLQEATKPLPPYNNPRLERMEKDLDVAVQAFKNKGSRGAFVKLSDRSPKDATTERGRILDFLGEPLQRYKIKNPNVNSSAVGLPAIYEAMMGALRVTSGRDALQLLLTSFRTMEDLQLRLNYCETVWEMKIAVREWVDFLIPFEFRGFVCNGQFNCMSQYYYDCYFPELVRHSEWIERSIRNYWRTLADKVPYPAYVIDFAVMKIDETQRTAVAEIQFLTRHVAASQDLPIKVIELNPFDEYTDGALFKWAAHRRLLTEGPWAFRFVTQEDINIQKKTWWKKILQDLAAKSAPTAP